MRSKGGLAPRPTGDQSFTNVGALLFDFDENGIITGEDALCSGSLIAPTVFLTAAHCVSFFPADAQLYVSFKALVSAWLWLKMNENATGLGGDCFGDSGSPKFLDGNTNLIVATVTTGDRFCRATSRDYRLDTPAARAFLGQFVSLP